MSAGTSPITPPTEKSKDFFISYNHRDVAWAEWVAWQLEASGYATIIQAWDFGAGSNFVLDMDRALKQAHKLVLVLSRNYLESRFTQPEWAAAFANDPTGQRSQVIPVRIEDVPIDGLLGQIVYIDLVGKGENEAKAELLSHLKEERRKPSQAPRFPGNSASPAFPGAPKEPSGEAQSGPDGSQFVIATEWPHGPLYSNSMHLIRVVLPPGSGWVRMKFEYKEELLWVSGPGKLPGTSEFVCEPEHSESAQTVELKLGIRSPHEECVEPITVYFFNSDRVQISESSANLELVPAPEPPSVVRQAIQTLRWLAGAEPDKPLVARALHVTARLLLLAMIAAAYYYYKTPDPVSRLKASLGLMPSRLEVALRSNPMDPFQEFPLGANATVRQAWAHPEAWTIEPGFTANTIDGKLRLVGAGTGSLPIPDGSSLYDFHIAMAIELRPQGSAAWIVRAQTRRKVTSPESTPGYHFTLTNRGAIVYLKAIAVQAPARLTGRADYNLLRSDERPLDLSATCCSPQDRIRVQIEAKGFDLNLGLHLQRLGPKSSEFPPDEVYIKDLRRGFLWGSFQIIQTVPGAGPAYEFIRLQDAS